MQLKGCTSPAYVTWSPAVSISSLQSHVWARWFAPWPHEILRTQLAVCHTSYLIFPARSRAYITCNAITNKPWIMQVPPKHSLWNITTIFDHQNKAKLSPCYTCKQGGCTGAARKKKKHNCMTPFGMQAHCHNTEPFCTLAFFHTAHRIHLQGSTKCITRVEKM